MIRCLVCGQKNTTKKGRGLHFLTCSMRCTWAWRDHIHFVYTSWKIPNLTNKYFIDLDINKRYG